MSLKIERPRVRSLDADRNEVTWEVTSGTQDVLDFTFRVLRSESPEGPFDPLTPEFEDRYFYVDARLPAGDKFRTLWYRIALRHKATDTTTYTESFAHTAEPDLIADYVRRHHQTVLQEASGRTCWILKRRTFGTRCGGCWDQISSRRTRSGCLMCYDTGYLRGYLNPIAVAVQIDPASKAQAIMPQQKHQEVVTGGRMGYYPNLSPDDLIVEAENLRWRVQTVTPIERLRAVVKQSFTARQLNDQDIEYKIPINLDDALRDYEASPPRMYVNATDFGNNVREKTPDIFALYATRPTNLKG